jgi:hypothetical protein
MKTNEVASTLFGLLLMFSAAPPAWSAERSNSGQRAVRLSPPQARAVPPALAQPVPPAPSPSSPSSPSSGPLNTGRQDDPLRGLLGRLERVVQEGNTASYLALLADSADRDRARDFGSLELMPGATRTVVQERDRSPLAGTTKGDAYRLMVDIFSEYGSRARVSSWKLDVKRVVDPEGGPEWAISDQERLTSVESLYRLSLDASKQFEARDLRISAEDIDLVLTDGTIFLSRIDQGVTALVLLGRGTLAFHPVPTSEKGQVKIFSGSETLKTGFDAVYVRVNPSDFDELVAAAQLRPVPIDPKQLHRAQDIFREESAKSFVIDLADLSREAWWLLLGTGDFLAEIHTRRYDTLTYARSGNEAEDITLFDRKRHKNIALYASRHKLASRGRFYSEDDSVDYDVLDYDIDLSVTPERAWLDGRARLRLRVRNPALNAVTLRLADPLVVQSVVSDEFGRLLGIRVKNQNALVVNLPATLTRGTELTLTITYAGRLEPQAADRETVGLGQGRPLVSEEAPFITAQASFLYSSRSYWYPQAPVTDYATARIRISVPASVDCVASGDLLPGFPTPIPNANPALNRKLYVFSAPQPVRYLAFLLSRFVRAETLTVAFPSSGDDRDEDSELSGNKYHSLSISVEANPRQVQRGRDLVERAADIASFYQSILGDCPYPSFTLALIEADLPGGHSPGYFAALNQPLPMSQLTWRNDPAAFANYPDFFIAHELAHQWWGQAVGWENYHEQWLSEGFAQFFAALYAQHERGSDTFAGMMRQLRHWSLEVSDQGPVYLGYRLGHLRSEGRVFRAIVYNKGAAVLQMLRRLAGDETFFRGLRRFYAQSRFRKVGTEDFRAVMEKETGLSLERFFERWIYGSSLPRLKFGYHVEGSEVVLHVEQLGDIFDLPLTVSLQYADAKSVDVIVRVTDRVVDSRIRLDGVLRGAEVSKDDGTIAEIVKE